MRPAEPYLTIDVPCASPDAVRGGIVSRLALFEPLRGAARVTLVSAPAGSGKTHLLRSWIAESGLVDSAAWVPVQHGEQDPQLGRGSGLVGLRDRVEALGGRIFLDSPPGKGTSLRMELPLTAANGGGS